jgi:hypothetical protein
VLVTSLYGFLKPESDIHAHENKRISSQRPCKERQARFSFHRAYRVLSLTSEAKAFRHISDLGYEHETSKFEPHTTLAASMEALDLHPEHHTRGSFAIVTRCFRTSLRHRLIFDTSFKPTHYRIAEAESEPNRAVLLITRSTPPHRCVPAIMLATVHFVTTGGADENQTPPSCAFNHVCIR